MRTYLGSIWWMVVLRGLLLIAFGVFAAVWPGLTLHGFAIGAAIYFTAVGVLNVMSGIGGVGRIPLWFLALALAAVEIAVGIGLFRDLHAAASTVTLLVGLVFVVRGIQELFSTFADGFEARTRGMYGIVGVMSLLAGILVWALPSNNLAFAWVVGVYGLAAGAILAAVAGEGRQPLGRV